MTIGHCSKRKQVLASAVASGKMPAYFLTGPQVLGGRIWHPGAVPGNDRVAAPLLRSI
jgi:hypothetical protein